MLTYIYQRLYVALQTHVNSKSLVFGDLIIICWNDNKNEDRKISNSMPNDAFLTVKKFGK